MSTARSGDNTCLREAASQFSIFLAQNGMSIHHSIGNFAEATAGIWISHSTNMSHTMYYVVVKEEDAAGIVCAAILPFVDDGHVVQDHVPSATTFLFKPQLIIIGRAAIVPESQKLNCKILPTGKVLLRSLE